VRLRAIKMQIFGCSDIIEVVSWLLNEDTEAINQPADIMALGREFESLALRAWHDSRPVLYHRCSVVRYFYITELNV